MAHDDSLPQLGNTLLNILKVPSDRSALTTAIREALTEMSALHRVPQRPVIPVVIGTRLREEGHYLFLPTVPNKAVQLAISRRATHPRLTLAHEAGHFLDNQVLHALKQDFASDYDEDFSELRIAWERTQTVKTLRHILSKHGPAMRVADRQYVKSLLTSHEMWASTYAQWVATKCENPSFQRELESEIPPTGSIAGIPFTSQWEQKEFKDIMPLVENLFRKRGLL